MFEKVLLQPTSVAIGSLTMRYQCSKILCYIPIVLKVCIHIYFVILIASHQLI